MQCALFKTNISRAITVRQSVIIIIISYSCVVYLTRPPSHISSGVKSCESKAEWRQKGEKCLKTLIFQLMLPPVLLLVHFSLLFLSMFKFLNRRLCTFLKFRRDRLWRPSFTLLFPLKMHKQTNRRMAAKARLK